MPLEPEFQRHFFIPEQRCTQKVNTPFGHEKAGEPLLA